MEGSSAAALLVLDAAGAAAQLAQVRTRGRRTRGGAPALRATPRAVRQS